MNCNYPVTIFDKRHNKLIQVPCGKCILCCASKARDWQNRIKLHFNHEMITFFVTLTYSDDFLPLMNEWYAKCRPLSCEKLSFKLSQVVNSKFDINVKDKINVDIKDYVPCLNPHDVTNYFKKLRINVQREHEKIGLPSPEIQYFGVGEYGPTTFRPHYHFIIGFTVPYSNVELMRNYKNIQGGRKNRDGIYTVRDYYSKFIEENWKRGHTKVSSLTEERIQYVTKYVYKFSDAVLIEYFKKYPSLIQPFKRSSNSIGYNFVKNNFNLLKDTNILKINRHNNRVPRYMREKIKQNLDEEELKEYENKISYTEEDANQNELKKLQYYCTLTHTPQHENIYDEDFLMWKDLHYIEKVRKIKQSFKKRKL